MDGQTRCQLRLRISGIFVDTSRNVQIKYRKREQMKENLQLTVSCLQQLWLGLSVIDLLTQSSDIVYRNMLRPEFTRAFYLVRELLILTIP